MGKLEAHDFKRRTRVLRWSDMAVLGVVAAHRPLDVMASNPVGISHPERLIALIVVVWTLSLASALFLIRRGFHRTAAVHTVFVSVLVLAQGGRLHRQFGTSYGWLLVLLIIGLSGFVFRAFSRNIVARAVMMGLLFALMSGLAISSYQSWQQWGTDAVVARSPLELSLQHRPDIFLVVLDGYPGLESHRVDGVHPNPALIDGLIDMEFQLPHSAWSAYWSTQLSIPSIFEMSYLVVQGGGGQATIKSLYDIIGGDNTLMSLLEANGYETTMIESGWSGSSCGSLYDNCVSAPLLEEAMYFTFQNTVAEPHILESQGYAFTVGAQDTMGWLLDNAARISRSQKPEMVFAHVMAPHPPFFLNPACETVVSRPRTGVQFYIRDVDRAARDQFFLEQRECVDDFMLRLADAVDTDDIVVFVSDHGTDRRLQLSSPPSEWDKEALTERMNVFVAVRTGSRCRIPDPVLSPNLMRSVLSCISSHPLELLPNRMWKKPMVEVDPEQVSALLNTRKSHEHD